MNKKIVLPLVEPVFSTYHDQGCSAAFISTNRSIKNWYINKSILLYCNKKFLDGYTSPQLQVKHTNLYEMSCIHKHQTSLKFLGNRRKKIVRDMLAEGYYIQFNGIDDYYVEGKSWYKTRHFAHNGMIYGYDDEKETYSIFAYDKNWIYKGFEVSQKCFWRGMKEGEKLVNDCYITAIKPKSETIDIDLKSMCFLLKMYLNPELGKIWLNMNNFIHGLEVHDYLCIYLNKIEDNSIPYERADWRVFRLLWEHKKMMLHRIIAVEELLGYNNDLSNEYLEIVKMADDIRMMYANYMVRRRDLLLGIIKSKLLRVKNAEMDVITRLVNMIQKGAKNETVGKAEA